MATCTIEGCARGGKLRRGWCNLHYHRWRRHGEPEHAVQLYVAGTAHERFDARVHRTDGCWLWTGHLNENGYGRLGDGDRLMLAHRWAWERENGPVPEGQELDHLCRVRRCVRPSHLEPVTHATNMARGAHPRKTQCPRGHPYSGANLYVGPDGKRRCRACRQYHAS